MSSMRTGMRFTPRSSSRTDRGLEAGFSLVEMLVAITVTLIIMGSVYGLITQGQNAFGREPLLADRQQQIRLAMDRIQKDVVSGGLGLGPYFQTFAPGLNAVGPVGVRVAADPLLGGGLTDHLEIRSQSAECPSVRTVPAGVLAGQTLQTVDIIPACFPDPGWVLLLYPDGKSKYGWLSNHPLGTNNQSTFANPQPDGSQVAGANGVPVHVPCAVWFGNQNNLASPNGAACPLAYVPPDAVTGCPNCAPYAIHQADFIRYELAIEDIDLDGDGDNADTQLGGAISLFRSTTGGIDPVSGLKTVPPGAQWQLIARGIEDLQVEYLSLNSVAAGTPWLNAPVLITDGAAAGPGDIVTGVRVTLWARAIGERPQVANNPGDNLAGESRAAGNLVRAVRGSFVSSMAPRAAQEALAVTGQWR